jgi:hypothetical protein
MLRAWVFRASTGSLPCRACKVPGRPTSGQARQPGRRRYRPGPWLRKAKILDRCAAAHGARMPYAGRYHTRRDKFLEKLEPIVGYAAPHALWPFCVACRQRTVHARATALTSDIALPELRGHAIRHRREYATFRAQSARAARSARFSSAPACGSPWSCDPAWLERQCAPRRTRASVDTRGPDREQREILAATPSMDTGRKALDYSTCCALVNVWWFW